MTRCHQSDNAARTEAFPSPRLTRCTKWFLYTAGTILAIVGAAKVAGSLGNAPINDVRDPIFGVPLAQLTLLVGIVELGVALVCFGFWHRQLSLGLVAWLGINFTAYRVGVALVGWDRPCECLGSLPGALGLRPEVTGWVTMSLLVYLLGGSSTLYFLHTKTKRVVSSTQTA
jgi:hypothetical protein